MFVWDQCTADQRKVPSSAVIRELHGSVSRNKTLSLHQLVGSFQSTVKEVYSTCLT
jgi:hypothetical protein